MSKEMDVTDALCIIADFGTSRHLNEQQKELLRKARERVGWWANNLMEARKDD